MCHKCIYVIGSGRGNPKIFGHILHASCQVLNFEIHHCSTTPIVQCNLLDKTPMNLVMLNKKTLVRQYREEGETNKSRGHHLLPFSSRYINKRELWKVMHEQVTNHIMYTLEVGKCIFESNIETHTRGNF